MFKMKRKFKVLLTRRLHDFALKELREKVISLAKWLTKNGVEQGDRVAVLATNSPETIRELAVKYMDNPEWVQVAFNPTKSGHFMDKIKGIPVTEADEVIQIGPLVLAKNVKYDLNLQPFSK